MCAQKWKICTSFHLLAECPVNAKMRYATFDIPEMREWEIKGSDGDKSYRSWFLHEGVKNAAMSRGVNGTIARCKS